MSRMYERKMSSPVTAVKTKEEKGDEFDKLLLAPQTYDETNDTKHDVETTRPIDYRGVVLVSFDEDGTIRYYRASGIGHSMCTGNPKDTDYVDSAKSYSTNTTNNDDAHEEFVGYASFHPPDGGYGWVIVLAAFFVQFFVLGTMNNFGILFTELLEEFQETKQATAWVGSITYGLMFATGPISTVLSERVGCRPVAVLGGVIAMSGRLLASFSDSIFKMYLTEGFLLGVGASLCFFPAVIILPQYFYHNLSMANGLVACGSGIGTMAMGPLMNYMNETYGWRVSIRVSSLLLLLCSCVSLTFRPNKQLQEMLKTMESSKGFKRPPLFDTTVFKNKGFLALTFALFIFMLAYFVPFVHLTQMALEYGIPMDKASLLIGFMSVASTFGRLFFGKIADAHCINRLYMYQIAMLGMGIANTICPLMKTFAGLLVYCTIFGFFEGCYVCQVAVITGDIVGIDRMAVAVGILFGIKSIPLTLGPPIAGFLYDVANSYQVAFYVAGAIPVIASLIMFSIPFLIPPKDDPFWNPSSKQYLIQDSSTQTCVAASDDNNNNNNQEASNTKTMTALCTTTVKDNYDADSLDCKDGKHQQNSTILYASRFLITSKEDHPSFTSICSFQPTAPVSVDNNWLSMRGLGSISSFGSVVFSPVSPLNQAQSSNLLIVDRVTNV